MNVQPLQQQKHNDSPQLQDSQLQLKNVCDESNFVTDQDNSYNQIRIKQTDYQEEEEKNQGELGQIQDESFVKISQNQILAEQQNTKAIDCNINQINNNNVGKIQQNGAIFQLRAQSHEDLQFDKNDFQTNMDFILQPIKKGQSKTPQISQNVEFEQQKRFKTINNQVQNQNMIATSKKTPLGKQTKVIELVTGAKLLPLLIPIRKDIDFEKLNNISEKGISQRNNIVKQKSISVQNNNNNNNEEQINEQTCKICLEGDQDQDSDNQNGELLTPCQCTGTCKFIHEECLKEWIISKHVNHVQNKKIVDFTKSVCEICNTKYNMSLKYGLKFTCAYALNKKSGMLSTLIISFLFSCGLLYLIYYFSLLTEQVSVNDNDADSQNNNNNQNSKQNNSTSAGKNSTEINQEVPSKQTIQPGYKFGIIVCSGIICFMFIVVLVLSFKETFFVKKVIEWKIKNYTAIEQQEQENINKAKIKQNQVLPIDENNNNSTIIRRDVNRIQMNQQLILNGNNLQSNTQEINQQTNNNNLNSEINQGQGQENIQIYN